MSNRLNCQSDQNDQNDQMIRAITRADVEAHKEWLYDREKGKRLCTAPGVVAIKTSLARVDLRLAKLSFSIFETADFHGSSFVDASMLNVDLRHSDLWGATFIGADMQGAILFRSNAGSARFDGAKLEKANLQTCVLEAASFRNANLRHADLSHADLYAADLCDADLRGADLLDTRLHGANLLNAKLNEAVNCENAIARTNILPEGDIIGWKMLQHGAICKLLIPADAKRSNATGRKCRAEFAKVLAIYFDGKEISEGASSFDFEFIYTVGEIVRPLQEFDTNRWAECSSGIHFYISRSEAEAN